MSYSCNKCPAYCCSYPEIEVTPRDIQRLAKKTFVKSNHTVGTIETASSETGR